MVNLNTSYAGISDDEWEAYCEKILHPAMSKATQTKRYNLSDLLTDLTAGDTPRRIKYLLVFTAAVNLERHRHIP